MSYIGDFTVLERLRDVLAWAEAVGRVTDEEAEFIEANMAAEAVERHRQAARLVAYQNWTMEAERQYREGRQQRDQERAKRDEQYIVWHRYLEDLELAGRLSEALGFNDWCEQRPASAVEPARWERDQPVGSWFRQ